MPPWCQPLYCSRFGPPWGGGSGAIPIRPGDRTAGWSPAQARHVTACGCRRRGAASGMLAHSGVAGEMRRHQARMRHALEPTSAGADRMRRGPARKHRRHGHRTRQRGSLARPSDDSRGATGQSRVLDRGRDCRGDRGGRGAGEAFPAFPEGDPRRRRRRTRGRRPMSRDTPGSPQATARQLHPWGLAQQCGSASSSSRDGGSPSKTNLARRPGPQTRRRARQLPSCPPEKKSRGAVGAASARGVPCGPALGGVLQARS